jgi:polyphosphate kinase 2 (PPK2 family)
LFDRSRYNRPGAEKVMGYCTAVEYKQFLRQMPVFEKMLIDDGILLYKYCLAVDQKEQERRFAKRAQERW